MSDTKAPRRYKIIASAECINMKPAHERYVSKTGEGSSQRTAATDAVDKIFKDDRVKKMRNKMPIKIVLSEGGD